MSTAWGAGTWGSGGWSGITNASFSVTGVAGTAELGNEGTVPQNVVSASNVVGTTAVGNVSINGASTQTVTGNSASILISGYESSTVTKTITVQSVSSSNKYFVDSVQQPTLELFEGNTYRFDQSDSSNNGHPLRFSTTSNGTHGGGSIYTTGVTTNGSPGSSGAYTEIAVATNTPTLYYYCTQHSAMGGQANTPIVYTITTTTGAPVTNVVGTTALGSESVTGAAEIAVTLNGLSISAGTLALSGTSVLSLIGVTGTGATGEEQVYSLIKPDQLANWIERVA